MLLRDFMKDNVTLKKGSIKLPVGGFIHMNLEKYQEMKKNTNKPFLHTSYLVTPGDTLTVHVKVPSKTLKKFYYDVLFELTPIQGASSIRDCHVKIFSNSPSFVYSYAYVFYHLDPEDNEGPKESSKKRRTPGMIMNRLYRKIPINRLLMPGTEDKYGDKVLQEPPVIRNPYNLPMFDSSLYMAIHYLEDVTTLSELKSKAKRITENQLLSSVADFESLMEERKRVVRTEGNEERKKRRNDVEKVKAIEKEIRKANSAVRITKPKSPTRAHAAISARKPKKPISSQKD